jgi:hypothetical protein
MELCACLYTLSWESIITSPSAESLLDTPPATTLLRCFLLRLFYLFFLLLKLPIDGVQIPSSTALELKGFRSILLPSISESRPSIRPWKLLPSQQHLRCPRLQHFNMPGLVSATGVLAFLADEEPELRVFALQTLNDDIDTVWTEVAGSLSQMYVSTQPWE